MAGGLTTAAALAPVLTWALVAAVVLVPLELVLSGRGPPRSHDRAGASAARGAAARERSAPRPRSERHRRTGRRGLARPAGLSSDAPKSGFFARTHGHERRRQAGPPALPARLPDVAAAAGDGGRDPRGRGGLRRHDRAGLPAPVLRRPLGDRGHGPAAGRGAPRRRSRSRATCTRSRRRTTTCRSSTSTRPSCPRSRPASTCSRGSSPTPSPCGWRCST